MSLSCPQRILRSVAATTWPFAVLLLSAHAPLLGQEQEDSATGTQPAPVDFRQLAADFARKTAKVQQSIAELPRTSLDPAAVVAEVGKDPRELSAWVATETRWVPYRGILRGPVGVLTDRRGNTVDRALLLMELLNAAGHAPTLHRGTIAEAQAARIYEALRRIDPGGTDLGAVPAVGDDDLQALAKRMGVSATEVRTELLAAQSKAQRAAERGLGQVMAQTEALVGFLDDTQAEAARSLEQREAAATLGEHFWVTLEAGGETLELDPLLDPLLDTPLDTPLDGIAGSLPGGAEPLERPASAASFPYADRTKLPAELYHTLTVTFEVERTHGSKIERRPALAHTFRPYELGAESLLLACAPLGYRPPTDAELSDLSPAQKVVRQRAALLAVDEWLPQLVVKGSLKESSSFRANGSLNDSPQTGTGRAVESAATTLAGLGGAGRKEPGEATALFVTFVATRPGAKGPLQERHERVVFDVLGDPLRRSEAGLTKLDETARLTRSLVGGYTADIAALFAVPSEVYVHGLALSTVQVNREAIIKMTLAQAEEDQTRAISMAKEAAKALKPRPVLHWTWGHLRRLYGGSDPRVFVDRINLISSVRLTTLPPGKDQGLMLKLEGIDVVMNHVGISPSAEEAPAEAAGLRLRQGVADTVLEATVATTKFGRDVGNTSLDFAQRTGPWARAAAAPKGAPGTVVEDFMAGMAVAPRPAEKAEGEARKLGHYWRIDPATGATLGMGPNGWGQSSAETLVQLQLAAIFIKMFSCRGEPMSTRPKCLAGALCSYVGLAVGSLTLNPIAGFAAGQLCSYATS